jgi:hypothetical protein
VHRAFPIAAVAAILVAAAPASAAASPVGNAVAAAKKKCKKQQVRVKINDRRLCRPPRKALPRPKAGDPRLLLVRSVFGRDWSRFRDRRGTKARSLPKLIRGLGPRAPALLAKATARGIARLDALAAGSASAARAAAAGCSDTPKGPRRQDSFTSDGGDGTQARVTATVGADGAAMAMELSGHGLTVKLDLDFGCDPEDVQAPSCPTAVGRLRGEIRYKLRAGVEVSRGGEDVWSQVMDVTRRTQLDGWTDVDAKLDRLDVEDVEISNFRLGGSTRGHPPISVRTKVIRRTQVDMRSGAYVPDRSDINVTVDTEGLGGPDRADVEDDIAEQSRAEADRQFRAIVDKAISGYRDREQRWQEPKKCAELRFSPVSNTLRLRPGQGGSFTATAIAKQDGAASELDGKLSNQVNATFSPTRAGGQQARFDYTVASATAGGKVSATVRATSKAGVDEATWEQPVEPPFEINKIAGNFSGRQTIPVGGRTGTISWTGGGTFERTPQGAPGATGSYILKAGSATFTFSGGYILGDAVCDMSGSAFVDLFQHGGGDISVSPVGSPFEQGPHDYSGGVFVGPTATVTLTLSSCEDPDFNGETRTVPVVQGGAAPFTTGQAPQQSPDGIHYDGSYSQSASGISTEWTWVLTGSK